MAETNSSIPDLACFTCPRFPVEVSVLKNNTYVYIFIMFLVSYLLRALPLTLIRREIKNRAIRSFLYYVPYVTLSVMTFPAIMDASLSPVAGLAALLIGSILAINNAGLFPTAMAAVVVVYVLDLVTA